MGDCHDASKKGPLLRADNRLVSGEGLGREDSERGAVTLRARPRSAGVRRPGRGPPTGAPHSSPSQVTAR